MKKGIGLILSVALLCAVSLTGFTGCTKRSGVLKVYNWGEYMDETVISEFENWYKSEYGEKIKVEYAEFESNEIALVAIENGKDYDVVCPSDYMIDRMRAQNLLQPIDKTVIDIAGEELLSEMLLEQVSKFDPNATYSVPYVWGTFGLMYDSSDATIAANLDKLDSWSALWDPALTGKTYMKKQERDSYAVAAIYANREKLAQLSNNFTDYNDDYKSYLDKLFQKFAKADFENDGGAFAGHDPVDVVKEVLKQQKTVVNPVYESDDGKMDMAQEVANCRKIGLFWNCDSGFVMSDFDRNGVEVDGNKNLRYVVPKEGSNLWIDGWVIPKTAKNTVAANRFIKFLCTEDIARLNAEYAGAQTCNKTAMEDYEADLRAEEVGEDGGQFPTQEFKDQFIEMLFPTNDILARCAVMRDFGNRYDDIRVMFEGIINS